MFWPDQVFVSDLHLLAMQPLEPYVSDLHLLASAWEIPPPMLFLRLGGLPALPVPLKSRILTYLPAQPCTTWLRELHLRVQHQILRDPCHLRQPTLIFFNELRTEATLSAYRTPGQNDGVRALLAHKLCCQIIDGVGYGVGPCHNLRLLRLVGQGPWERYTTLQFVRIIMEQAIGFLLELAGRFPIRNAKPFLYELMRVNSAWASEGFGHHGTVWSAPPSWDGMNLCTATPPLGLHGWAPSPWTVWIDKMYAEPEPRGVPGYEGCSRCRLIGACEFQTLGQPSPCGEPCEACMSNLVIPGPRFCHDGECACAFHVPLM